MTPTNIPPVNVENEEELKTYFARLEREYPQLIEAMKVMNISYRQYLAALQLLQQPPTYSNSSTKLTL